MIKKNRRGGIKRKLVLMLMAGVAMGLTRSPKRNFEILGELSDEFRNIKRSNLKRAIKSLYGSVVIKEETAADGTIRIVLTDIGQRWAAIYALDDLKIKKPKRWDGNWRVVIFDIPERLRKVRESFRMHLRNFGFVELQKSVFVHPFPSLTEVGFVIKFYNLQKFVRLLTANSIDNEPELMKRFDLS